LEADVDPSLKKANSCARNERFFLFCLCGVAMGTWVEEPLVWTGSK